MHKFLSYVCLVALTAGLCACDSGRQTQPSAPVTVVHAAAGFGALIFKRVERNDVAIGFKGATSYSFQADTYTFNVDLEPPAANTLERVTSFTQPIVAGTAYVFALVEIAGKPEPVIAANPVFDSGSSDAQVLAIHAGAALSQVDVFLEPPGTDLSTVAALGQMNFTDVLSPATVSPGTYVVSVTAAGNPANLLFTSSSVSMAAGQSSTIVLMDGDNPGFTDINVVLLTPAPNLLIDPSLPSGLRVINAADDQAARDIYLNGDFTAPLIGAAAFGMATNRVTVPSGSSDLTVTPAGNPGVFEIEQQVAATPGFTYSYFLSDSSAGLQSLLLLEDRRPLTRYAKLHMLHAASNFGLLDAILLNPGDTIDQALLGGSALPNGQTQIISLPPGTYDLVIRDTATGTIVNGPQPVTVNAGGLYSVLAVNNVDGATVDLILLDGFN